MGNRDITSARNGARAVLALWLSTLASGCGGPDGSVLGPDHRGEGPSIVSLNPCLDAILVEIADPSQIRALSHYSRDPGSSSIPPDISAQMAITGGTAEEIIALSPDIVLASSFIAPATRRALERAGLRVETFDSPTRVDDSVEQIRRIAELAAARESAEPLIAEMRTKPEREIAMPAGPAADRPTALLWQPGQIVPGRDTLISQLLREAGFASHSERRGLGQADYVSLEKVLADPPDLLLVAGDSRAQQHPLLEDIPGTLVEPFETNLLFCAGPTIPKVRSRLAAIHDRMVGEPAGKGAR